MEGRHLIKNTIALRKKRSLLEMSMTDTSFIDRVEGPLERLGRLFCFTRRELTQTILDEAAELEASLALSRHQLASSQNEIHQIRQQLQQQIHQNRRLEQEQMRMRDQLLSVTTQHKRLQQHFKHAVQVIEQQRQQNIKLNSSHAELNTEFAEYENHWALIRSILTTGPSADPILADFHRQLESDFTAFVNSDNSYERKTEALRVLRSVEKELQLLSATPDLATKTLISLYGPAGSGKSSLINCFLSESDAHLPIDVDPAISLAHYVYFSDSNRVTGYTANGGSLDIEPVRLQALPLHTDDNKGFDLGAIMPFTTVAARLEASRFEHICLVKHPGYKPADARPASPSDLALAAGYLNQANAMLWVMDLTRKDALSASAINMLGELERPDRPLYILLSKAEHFNSGQLVKALDRITELLDKAEIRYEGVGAFNTHQKKCLLWRRQNLDDFLRARNKPTLRYERLLNEVVAIFNSYRITMGRMIRRNEFVLSQLHDSEQAFIEQADAEALADFRERIYPIRNLFDNTELVERERKAQQLCATLSTTIQRLFAAVMDIPASNIPLPEITSLDYLLLDDEGSLLASHDNEGGWEDALAAELDNPAETPYDSATYSGLLDFLRQALPERSASDVVITGRKYS
jgi:regulator of replication initiation timing